ncbi:hypothetical protein TNCV_3946381 [Trichonephila clavipes]|nr:hypothetical protein TNCV_3946381 [Trichonephila clavipes]
MRHKLSGHASLVQSSTTFSSPLTGQRIVCCVEGIDASSHIRLSRLCDEEDQKGGRSSSGDACVTWRTLHTRSFANSPRVA